MVAVSQDSLRDHEASFPNGPATSSKLRVRAAQHWTWQYHKHGMSEAPILSVTMLGAGQEVGRSCCVLQYRGKTIVCDAGVHPAHSGMASLPFIDDLDWSTVDAILITQ